MLLTFQMIHVGMTVYHDGEASVITEIQDVHNIRSIPEGKHCDGATGKGINLLCLVPGCELYRPLFSTKEESLRWEAKTKDMAVAESYSIQNGCWNCKKCFIKSEYDEEYEHYCNVNEDRPLCDSVAMGELQLPSMAEIPQNIPSHIMMSLYREKQRQYDAQVELWDAWSKTHTVNHSGMCHKWEHK